MLPSTQWRREGARSLLTHAKEDSMKELIKKFWNHLIAEGRTKDSRKVYHFELPHGEVLEIIL